MRLLVYTVVLGMTLARCGVRTHSQVDWPLFSGIATTRRCVRRIDMRTEGYAMGGIHGTFKEYPQAKTFSDEWIEMNWLIHNRALHADITNRSKASLVIGAVIIQADEQRVAMSPVPIEAGASERIRLSPLRDMPQLPSTAPAPAGSRLELRVRASEEECTYQFQLPGAV
jgi:hypothetical protein